MSPPPAVPPPGPEPASTRAARAVVRGLAAQGVRDVVLCPGSRSAPLAYALLAAHEAGWLRLHVRIDERAAGFLALGLTHGRATEEAGGETAGGDGAHVRGAGTDEPVRPVGAGSVVPLPAAVVTTSGTAVANLHPAVLEAAHAGLPLVVVTADRPHEMRGTGANQTTDQVGIFGSAVRWSADLPAGAEGSAGADPAVEGLVARGVAAARGVRTANPGPVHLNVALRDPLTPVGPWAPGEIPTPRPRVLPRSRPAVHSDGTVLRRGPRTVVIAGDGSGPAARILAEAAGWPLLAEPTSGARSGPNAVGPGRLLLDVPELAEAVERVVVLGHPTLSRPVTRLLARAEVEVVVIAPTGAIWTDVAGTAALVCTAVALADPDPDAGPDPSVGERAWLARWQVADTAAREVLDAHMASGPLDGRAVARAVAEATEDGAGGARTLVVGASSAIRDLDLAAVPPPGVASGLVLANRGLAGIDGTLATAAGVALARDEPVRVLVGDLTFLHDIGGLAVGALEAVPDLQVVVVNDDGGGIFATLEHGAPERAAGFDRLFGTPQAADLGALADGFGVRFLRVCDIAGLRAALTAPVHGRRVIEVRVDRSDRRHRHAALGIATREAVQEALREAT